MTRNTGRAQCLYTADLCNTVTSMPSGGVHTIKVPASTTASFTFIGNRVEETGVDKRLGSSMDRCEAQPRTFRHI